MRVSAAGGDGGGCDVAVVAAAVAAAVAGLRWSFGFGVSGSVCVRDSASSWLTKKYRVEFSQKNSSSKAETKIRVHFSVSFSIPGIGCFRSMMNHLSLNDDDPIMAQWLRSTKSESKS